MAFVEDFSAYFADFGVAATVGGVAVTGVFDKMAAEAFGVVSGNDPQLVVTDTVTASQGTAVSIGGTSYAVAEVIDDGTGLRVLKLEKA